MCWFLLGSTTLNKTFDGAEPKVGAVLGLTVEKIDKKVPFTQFRDKMINYVGREHPMGDMLTCIIKDGSDPQNAINDRYQPKDLTDDELKVDVKIRIYMENLKR